MGEDLANAKNDGIENNHGDDNHPLFNRRFIYQRILTSMWNGKGPTQIAGSLHCTPQRLNPYVQELKDKGVIAKKGYMWELTPIGRLTVKRILSRGVKPSAKYDIFYRRVHHTCIGFKVKEIPHELSIKLKNGVSKAVIDDLPGVKSVEVIRSTNEWESVMEIHLPEVCVMDTDKALIQQMNLARRKALLQAERMRITISEDGFLIGKRQRAFVRDPLAPLLAKHGLAEMETESGGKVWFDSSNGDGELETDDAEYEAKYLMVPEITADTNLTVYNIHSLWLSSLAQCGAWHPSYTTNA